MHMLAMAEQVFKQQPDELQFQSAMRAMVVVTQVFFLAGCFLGPPKCNLIPEKVMTYLGIDCDYLHARFLVREERTAKYIPIF